MISSYSANVFCSPLFSPPTHSVGYGENGQIYLTWGAHSKFEGPEDRVEPVDRGSRKPVYLANKV